jgi:hypothetical protein
MAGVAWPRFLPDLTYWHAWHFSHDTLPERWKRRDLSAICRELEVPEWRVVRPWRSELPGIVVNRRQDASEKVVTWETKAGTLRAKWVLGPDGDWWQSEYPVKSRVDFDAAREIVRARRYVAEPSRAAVAGPPAELMVALELPRTPLPELFHSLLGWSEGLMLFLEEPDIVRELSEILDGTARGLVGEIARMPGSLAIAPDNLDGRFIAPEMFAESIAPLYARAAGILHTGGKTLVVHVGGPIRNLLPGLAGCGVDCAEGVCGAPQGDSTFSDARAACGPSMILWGGIPQDFLLDHHTPEEFGVVARAAFADAAADPRVMVGVADMVPVNAVPERLDELARLAREARPRKA